MHVMDDVQGIDIHAGQPFHHILIFLHDLIIIQVLGGDGTVFRGLPAVPVISSTPPLMAYSRHLARLARAPKNCISLPITHGGYAAGNGVVIAMSGTLIRSSFSYWMEEDLMEVLAQNRLKFSGRLVDQSTVRLGSGAGTQVYPEVCRIAVARSW